MARMVVEPGWVYLFRMLDVYKIGATNDVDRRLKDHCGMPYPVTKVHAIKSEDCYGIEEALHKRFVPSRTNGEWFALTEEDVELLKKVECCDSADELPEFLRPEPGTKWTRFRARRAFRRKPEPMPAPAPVLPFLVRIEQAQEMLSLDRDEVLALMASGGLACVQIGKKTTRIRTDSLRDLIRRGSVPATR